MKILHLGEFQAPNKEGDDKVLLNLNRFFLTAYIEDLSDILPKQTNTSFTTIKKIRVFSKAMNIFASHL